MQQYHSLSKKQILGGLGIYFIIRLFSYFYSPSTPLYAANPVNWLISAGILAATVYFLLKKDIRGWLIIAAEIILGGAGSLLEIKGVSLRTCLLIISIIIFVIQKIKDKEYLIIIKQNKYVIYLLSFIMAAVIISAVRGYFLGHNLKFILADAIPYLFFLYYFPLKQLLSSEKFRQTAFSMIIAAIIGNFIFIYFTLAGFSSEIFVLQDSYYHWFRDVAGGKITDYGTGFFRILLNEQLLLIPIFLWLFGKIVSSPPLQGGVGGGLSRLRESRIPLAAGPSTATLNASATPSSLPLGKGEMTIVAITAVLLLGILTINITRIYLVALAIGILFLFSVKNWKRWLTYSAAAFIFFITVFSLTHLAATKGKSLGWEYLGLRLQSIAAPQTEDSSLSRLLLLPKIWEKIKLNPLLGNGLGDTITVYSPVFKINITTPHFDWGYLEIWDEMGIIGLMAWIIFIIYLLSSIIKSNKIFLAPAVALLVINITSPALFHALGIVLIAYFFSTGKATPPPPIPA